MLRVGDLIAIGVPSEEPLGSWKIEISGEPENWTPSTNQENFIEVPLFKTELQRSTVIESASPSWK
jgi:hypothetical protein